MVDTPDERQWSSWHNMVGKEASPDWLATDASLKRIDAIPEYINFVDQVVNKSIWDDLQHQMFLGDETLVEKHQLMQKLLEGDISEIPFKQRSVAPLSLDEYQQHAANRNEAIIKAYQSGGYTMKQIGGYFEVHYSLISRIAAASENKYEKMGR
jgi:putative transposase